MKTYRVCRVCELLGFGRDTVRKRFDSGQLRGVRRGVDRRRFVDRRSLIKELKRCKLSLAPLKQEKQVVVIVSNDNNSPYTKKLAQGLKAKNKFLVRKRFNRFEYPLRSLWGKEDPDCVLVDFALYNKEGLVACERIRAWFDSEVFIIGLVPPGYERISSDAVNEYCERESALRYTSSELLRTLHRHQGLC